MRDGTSRVGVGQQFIAYQLFMSPTSLHRYDRYALETVSSEAGRDRQQPLQSGQFRSGRDCLAMGLERVFCAKGLGCAPIEGDDPSRPVLSQHDAIRAKQFLPIPRNTGTRLASAQPRRQKSQPALTG